MSKSNNATLDIEDIKFNPSRWLDIIRIGYKDNRIQIFNFLSRALLIGIRIWVFEQLYRATYAVAGTTEISGLDMTAALWTVVIVQGLQNSARPVISKVINNEVMRGDIAYRLNRPISYIGFILSFYFGQSIVNILSALVVGLLMAIGFTGLVEFNFVGILFGLVLIVGGLLLYYLMEICIGLLSFYINDIEAISWIFHKFQLFAGGAIIPLAFYPLAAQKVFALLPFSVMFYAPAIAITKFNLHNAVQALIVQIIWIVVFYALSRWLFNGGSKKVSLNGG